MFFFTFPEMYSNFRFNGLTLYSPHSPRKLSFKGILIVRECCTRSLLVFDLLALVGKTGTIVLE
jgi:hypothetical protein